MKVLLDTCSFIWLLSGSSSLSDTARRCIQDMQGPLFLSVVSMWEVALKYYAGKLSFPAHPGIFIPETCKERAISMVSLMPEEVFALEGLPVIHRDPFDRMLVSQARMRGMTILTPDRNIQRYPVETMW